MSIGLLFIYILKFYIPALFSILFRAFGLGYKSKKRLIIGLISYTVYVFVVSTILIIIMGYGQFTHLSTIVMVIASMSVLIFTTDKPGKTMFIQLTQGNVTTVISVILNMVRHIFNLSYLILDIMILIVCPIFYMIALRFLAKPMRFICDNIHSNIAALLSLSIITMIVVYFIPIYPLQNFSNYPLYCTVIMLGVELAYILYIYTFYGNLRKICLLSKQQMTFELI